MIHPALERAHRQWTVLGERVPFWAILTHSGGPGKSWERTAFFRTGEVELAEVIRRAEGVAPVRFGVAVDFGCGVGRVTQALARRFNAVVGIDVSEPMIREATRLSEFGDRCRFVHNVSANIDVIPSGSTDFVYSNITLQHVVPTLAKHYIQEFFRIASPGAHIVFQLPAQPRSMIKHRAKKLVPVALINLLWRVRTSSPAAIETYFIPESEIRRVIQDSGGRVELVDENQDGPAGWRSLKYFCVR